MWLEWSTAHHTESIRNNKRTEQSVLVRTRIQNPQTRPFLAKQRCLAWRWRGRKPAQLCRGPASLEQKIGTNTPWIAASRTRTLLNRQPRGVEIVAAGMRWKALNAGAGRKSTQWQAERMLHWHMSELDASVLKKSLVSARVSVSVFSDLAS